MTQIRIGYIRIQNIRQDAATLLKNIGIQNVYTEEDSSVENQPRTLAMLLQTLKPNDKMAIYKMSNLARSVTELQKIILLIVSRGILIEFIHENLMFSSDGHKATNSSLSYLAAFASFEQELKEEMRKEDEVRAKTRKMNREAVKKLCSLSNLQG